MKSWFTWTGVVLLTLLMIGVTFFFMKLPWLAGDEKLLIWTTSAIKLMNRQLPQSEEFAFINTSYDLQLIDHYDEFGFPVGNQAITDRQKLTNLLQAINEGPHKPRFILIDIHFRDPTDQDEALAEQLHKTENLILSAHFDEEGGVEAPIFDVDYGISDYVTGSVFEGVYKYQLFYQDTMKFTPLRMYETLHKEEAANRGFTFVSMGDRWMPNHFIINYRLLQGDVNHIEAGFNPVNLGELLFLPEEDIQAFVANKIVVIGDFKVHDMHETLFEITSGPIVLINAYLTLVHGDTKINWLFIALMLVTYGYLSYTALYEGDFLEKKLTEKYGKVPLVKFTAGFINYLIILSVLSTLTFFLFNIHLNVFFIACIYYAIDRLRGFGYKIQGKNPAGRVF